MTADLRKMAEAFLGEHNAVLALGDASAPLTALLARVRSEALESAAKACDRWAASNSEAFLEQSLAATTCAIHIRALDSKGAAGR